MSITTDGGSAEFAEIIVGKNDIINIHNIIINRKRLYIIFILNSILLLT
jgi:hypothetical protein